ncbi:endonuclease/exonuclease/phosphatase family protein [Maritalea sp.]|uniref:endonuclease/exonuclease/phosphatase family protein n=1 Tax=Maritalea sp. TaxID=2003361 RepID=UPI003EF68BFD
MIIKRLKPIFLFLFSSGAFFVSLAAIAGFLAFAFWPLDVFNHFQPVIFPVTLVLFVTSAIFAHRQPFRGLMLSVSATGFIASCLVTVPEIVGAIRQTPQLTQIENTKRLMTFNIYAKNEDIEGLFASIKDENPDVLLMQEYWRWHRGELEERLTVLFPYSVHCQGGKRSFLGIYSKLPLKELPGHNCIDKLSTKQRTSIIAVQVQDEIPFNVITTHFDWPIPAGRQREQMQTVVNVILAQSGPTLFGGDFNSTPFSYSFKNLVDQSKLKRAVWLMPTWPAPPTHPVPMPAWLQLDHILASSHIKPTNWHRGANGGSDHYPLVIDFQIYSGELN